MKRISTIARKLGIPEEDLEIHGPYAAKIRLELLEKLKNRMDGKLILVTAMTPTKTGEGKTTTSIGLAEGLNRIGKKAIVTLRQPSLGPFFGIKGGATGGGRSTIEPQEEINLHLTGDNYAVATAHNLLSAMLDNHIYHGNELRINRKRIMWPRTVNVSDRALRKVTVGKWGKTNALTKRHEHYIITAASEIMAVLCLAKDKKDLRTRLKRLVVGYTTEEKQIRAEHLKADGAMELLLKHAIKPNLVQTSDETPALVHGGAFANVAHGTNSVIATRMALKLVGQKGFVVIESGFGSDLGAEKFVDIACRAGGFSPCIGVIIATIKALETHGQGDVKKGLENLWKHVENVKKLGMTPIVALNRFKHDHERDMTLIKHECRERKVAFEISECFGKGGHGSIRLARMVVKLSKKATVARPIYGLNLSLKQKVELIAREIYGARGVAYSRNANRKLKKITKRGFGKLPVCIAKTPLSLSDKKEIIGRPVGFKVRANNARIMAGAGHILIEMGDIMLMPGLPKHPAAEKM